MLMNAMRMSVMSETVSRTSSWTSRVVLVVMGRSRAILVALRSACEGYIWDLIANARYYEGVAKSEEVLFFETPSTCCEAAHHVEDGCSLVENVLYGDCASPVRL